MKSVTRKEKIEYLIITVLLMILVAEGFAIRDIRVENREQQEVTVSERVYLKHNESGIDTTGSDEVDSYFYIECEYDSDCDLEICDKKSFERAKYDVCYIKAKEPNTEHEQY